MPTDGGAVIVQMFAAHENAGKSVRPPMIEPCVLDVAIQSAGEPGAPSIEGRRTYQR